MNKQGTLFTVSAPSGAGKTSLVKALVADMQDIQVSISHTTREIRAGEENGRHYHFVDRETFETMINGGEFLEYAPVFTKFYGTSKNWVDQTLSKGIDVILEIDWQGANQVRAIRPGTVSVFILPPAKDVLLKRLQDRGRDNPTVIQNRMAEARNEMSHYYEADYLIINDKFPQALTEFKALVLAERLKIGNQQINHKALLLELLS